MVFFDINGDLMVVNGYYNGDYRLIKGYSWLLVNAYQWLLMLINGNGESWFE